MDAASPAQGLQDLLPDPISVAYRQSAVIGGPIAFDGSEPLARPVRIADRNIDEETCHAKLWSDLVSPDPEGIGDRDLKVAVRLPIGFLRRSEDAALGEIEIVPQSFGALRRLLADHDILRLHRGKKVDTPLCAREENVQATPSIWPGTDWAKNFAGPCSPP
jgi:hypothetical protein